MAKLVGGDPRSTRGISLNKQYMVDVYRGTIRVRKWPKKRGPPKTDAHREQVEKFSQANRLAKYALPQSQVAAISATKNTSFYPRDLQVMAMYGRAWALAFPGQRTLWPVAARQDVSGSLDVLASTEGDLLARGPNFWSQVPGGTLGQVLTSNGGSLLPSFKPAGPFTGAVAYAHLTAGGTDNANFATKGWWFKVLSPLRVHGMVATLVEVIGATYIVRLFSLSGSTIVAEISTTLEQTGVINGTKTRQYDFTSTPDLVVGTDYAFMLSRTDATDTTKPGNVNVATNPPPIPLDGVYGWCRIAKKNPVATDVLAGKDTTFKPYPFPILYETGT